MTLVIFKSVSCNLLNSHGLILIVQVERGIEITESNGKRYICIILNLGLAESTEGWRITKTRVTGFEFLTWNRMCAVLLSLAGKIIKSGFVPDVIVGVSRGGWIPARVLCDLLGTPVLASVGVESYTGVGERKGQPRLTQPLSAAISGKKVLVVDEVADTGKSLMLVKEYVIKEGSKDVRTVTMYTKPWTTVKPDYHQKETSRWIVFPWEMIETTRAIVAGSKWEKTKELDDLEHARLTARQAQRFLNKILEGKYKSH